MNQLKSHYVVNSTLVTALEYFKYIQVGFYNIFTSKQSGIYEKHSTAAFKRLRSSNNDFSDSWNLRLEDFKRTFRKHFPPYDSSRQIYSLELIQNFDGTKVDFGDEVLYHYALTTEFPLIITADRDFRSFPDNLNIVFL